MRRFDISPLLRPVLESIIAFVRFRCLLTAAAVAVWCAGTCPAAAPYSPFVLEDLNPNSSRVGQDVSQRDYRQWISAYYFGQEA